MKILIISPSISRSKGGVATVVDTLLNSNPNNYGFEMEHLITHVEGSAGEKIGYFFRSCFNLIGKKDLSIVHIHVNCYKSFFRKSVLTLISRLKRIPVIIHVHGSDFDKFYNESSFLIKFFIRKTFQSCKKVLVLSEYWQEFFLNNIVSKNVEILYNGVDTKSFKNCLTTSDKISKFLFLGRLGQRKGIYDLLEAINILVNKKNYKNITFFLAGDGDLKEVGSLINALQLNKNVFLLGWVNDKKKEECLKNTYTVILPSYSEGLPMALLESMASGKVIISSKVGGIPELVEEGKNGFLVTPGEVDEIVENILYVLNHKEEMEQISSNNIKKVEQKYSLEKQTKRLYEIYSESLAL
jgi:glycosyltransferase involved in cell wall biosynthesis